MNTSILALTPANADDGMKKGKKIDLSKIVPACLRWKSHSKPDPKKVEELEEMIKVIAGKRREEKKADISNG